MKSSNGDKVLILGGAGAMGRVAADTIQDFENVSKIVIADLNKDRAEDVASGMWAKVQPMQLDALNREELTNTLKQFDYVISTLGPFYKFGTHVLNAAIECNVDYLDICDDWEPTLELLELDEKAKKAGVRALVGAGASPGISNMLAVKAVKGVKRPVSLYTGWGARHRNDNGESVEDASSIEGPAAATDHWVQQFTGSIRVRENGFYCESEPLQEHILPHPLGGKCKVYSLGHPEPVTFPRYYPQIQNSYNVMDMSDFIIATLKSLRLRVDAGELSIRDAAIFLDGLMDGSGNTMRASDYVRYFYSNGREILRNKKYMPDLHATAIGTNDDKHATSICWMNGRIPGGMGPMTCIPTAVFLSMFVDREIQKTGVFAPEAAADPDTFFSKLEKYVEKDDPTLPLIQQKLL